MFVILTSKAGQYHTHANADIELLEAWDYLFYGRPQAQFAIGRLLRETRVKVVEAGDASVVNWVPSKFLERFETLEKAHAELANLCKFGNLDARLVACPLENVARD